MQPILEIKNISKKFRIQHEQQPYLSLRDSVAGFFSSPFGGGREGVEDFWALKDVSFDVYPGESIGIIGKNGAGKSTLLKILSKITPPTEGKIISRGRIASLLEVGTGFHPELSGRENIFLNGSILGMKRKEIQKKFDEIVDFSGVEKFLDTPLKHYSSGMQLRLAFAVAAFLEPEILLIDEVLAVGDAEFQRKCLGKMDEVSKSGRTVIFVSHNTFLLSSICTRGILLENGEVSSNDGIQNVINNYKKSIHKSEEPKNYQQRQLYKKNKKIIINGISFLNNNNENSIVFTQAEDIKISVKYEISDYEYLYDKIKFSINMYDTNGVHVFHHNNNISGNYFSDSVIKENNELYCTIKNLSFNKGIYFFSVDIVESNRFMDLIENAGTIQIIEGKLYNNKQNVEIGIVCVDGLWKI